MRVCVIGGTGNISTSIVSKLLKREHDVTAFVRGQRTDELPPEVRRLRGDRRDRAAFEETMRAEAFEAVIDMISFGAADAESLIRATEGSAGHVVHCSTASVQAQAERVPTPEDEPYSALGDYARNKVEAERVLMEAHERTGFPVTIMRPSYTYGRVPLLRQIGFDNSFPNRLSKRMPVLVVDDAEQTRWQALHVDDAGIAFAACIGRPACIGRTYNVVGHESMTWADLHRRFARALGLPEPELVGRPLGEIVAAGGEHTRTCATITAYTGVYDDTAIRRDVPEFRQTISYEDGIARNVEWLSSRGLLTEVAPGNWEDGLLAQA